MHHITRARAMYPLASVQDGLLHLKGTEPRGTNNGATSAKTKNKIYFKMTSKPGIVQSPRLKYHGRF